MNREARLRGRRADKVDHDLIGFQRLAAPIAGHVAKQAVLDLVPLARAWWEMAHLDLQAGFVAEALQFDLPQAISATIAAATVGRDQQPPRVRVTTMAQPLPPGPNRFHGEFGRIAADPDTHPGFVVGQIVDAVRHRLPCSRVRKVVDSDLARLAFPAPRLPRILEISQGFLLLGVDRDCWLSLPLLRLHPAIDVAKLGIAVRMRLPFLRLAVGLQTVARRLEQVPHGGRPHGMSLSRQFFRQAPRAFAGPPQRRLRVPSTIGFHQPFQAHPDVRVSYVDSLASRSGPALAPVRRRGATVEFTDAASNGAVGQAGRRTHRGNATATQRNRLHGRPTSPRELRQLVVEPSVLILDPLNDAPIHGGRDSVKPLQLMSRPFLSIYLRAVPNPCPDHDCLLE